MGDYTDRNQFGDIYVELSAITPESAQVRLGQSEAGDLFETQACDSEGVFQDILATSEIAIGVSGANRVADLAAALRWLADAIEANKGGPRLAR